MIELNTGVPGSGKTLSMVQRLSKLISRWEAHPDEARPIFISGIPDLKLPHAILPLKSVLVLKAGAPMLVPDWDEMPDGSLVIIDEAQGCFPPRSSASASPIHVAWLNTHRHKGFDIWLTTQHPKLIDASVRALVGKHQHYRRIFGMARAVVYEWDCCSDSLAGMKNAVKSYFKYPRNTFHLYKSAEIHTKQKFKLPLWFLIPFVGLALAAYSFPRVFHLANNIHDGKGIKVTDDPPLSLAKAPLSPLAGTSPAALAVVSAPEPQAIPETQQISACLATTTHCQCYNHDGIHIAMSFTECLLAADAPTDKFRLNVAPTVASGY